MPLALANRLKDLRYEKNLKQVDIADKLGISQVAYGRFELGSRKPKEKHLKFLSEFYDVSLDYLLGETGDRKGNSYSKYLILDDELPTKEEGRKDGTKFWFYILREFSTEDRIKIRDLILQLRIGSTSLYEEFEKLDRTQRKIVLDLLMQLYEEEIDSGKIKGDSYTKIPDILKYGKNLDINWKKKD